MFNIKNNTNLVIIILAIVIVLSIGKFGYSGKIVRVISPTTSVGSEQVALYQQSCTPSTKGKGNGPTCPSARDDAVKDCIKNLPKCPPACPTQQVIYAGASCTKKNKQGALAWFATATCTKLCD